MRSGNPSANLFINNSEQQSNLRILRMGRMNNLMWKTDLPEEEEEACCTSTEARSAPVESRTADSVVILQ